MQALASPVVSPPSPSHRESARAMTPTGVLLLAYGTPETTDDVEPYFRHIRGGRAPSPEAVEQLRRRYELVGGRTPLLAITNDTARGLHAALDRRGPGDYRTYVAMKHWHPFIADVIPRIASEGVRRLIVLVLAPHYSRLSIGGYRDYVEQANAALDTPLDVSFVESWHLQPEFIAMMSARVCEGLAAFPERDRGDVCVLFSAHSLPVRIRTWEDPYEAQLDASCAMVAKHSAVRNWRFAWQSAGKTGEPWLGPDITDYLDELHAEGVRHVLSVPIGFVCEHLEVLYDIDHEAAQKAASLGMTLHRTRMPNATPELIAVLDALVAGAEGTAPVSGAAAAARAPR